MIDGIKFHGEVQEDTQHMLAVFQNPGYFIDHDHKSHIRWMGSTESKLNTYQNIFFHTTLFHHIYISLWPQDKAAHISKAQRILKYANLTALVTSYDNETHNNAPKANGNGLKQCGIAITRSIFFKFSQQTTHISPVRARNVCLLCFSSLNCVLLLSVQCCVYIRDKLDRVITAPDCTTETSTVYDRQYSVTLYVIRRQTNRIWDIKQHSNSNTAYECQTTGE